MAGVTCLAATLPCPAGRIDLVATRQVARQAQRAVARGAPDKLPRVEALLSLAEEVTRRELSAPSWRRNFEALDAAWERAYRAAAESQLTIQASGRSTHADWAGLESRASQATAAAAYEARTPGLGHHEAKLAAQARVSLDAARRLAAAGSWPEAQRAAETAIGHAERVRAGWLDLHARYSDRTWLARWQSMADVTVAESARRGTVTVVVDKLRRRLDVYSRGQPVASFAAELGASGLRPKLHAGDRATPEGRYEVSEIRTGDRTAYYKALLLDYPNTEDLARWEDARRRGSIPRWVGPGGLIEIHGDGGQGRDWTDGCVALSNDDMDRLLEYVGVGAAVTIVGTRSPSTRIARR